MATLAALASALLGLRDGLASQRCLRLAPRPAAQLVAALSPHQTVLVTGAIGFIGSRLVEPLVSRGHKVIALVRAPDPNCPTASPLILITSLNQIEAGTCIDVIVHLAGEPIANALWTKTKRHRILASRIDVTDAVVALIGRLASKPRVLVSGSAIGWYGLWIRPNVMMPLGFASQSLGYAIEGNRPEVYSAWRFFFIGLEWWVALVRGS
jgi:uncharacterized protein